MSKRLMMKNLEWAVRYLREVTGMPLRIDASYGHYRINRALDRGGERTVSPGGTLHETYDWCHAYGSGYRAAQGDKIETSAQFERRMVRFFHAEHVAEYGAAVRLYHAPGSGSYYITDSRDRIIYPRRLVDERRPLPKGAVLIARAEKGKVRRVKR